MTLWENQTSFLWSNDQASRNLHQIGSPPPLLQPGLDLEHILECHVFGKALVTNGPFTPGAEEVNTPLTDRRIVESRIRNSLDPAHHSDPNGWFRSEHATYLKSEGTFDGQRFTDKMHAQEVTTARFKSDPFYGPGYYDHIFLCLRLTCRLMDRQILALFFPHFYMPWPRRIHCIPWGK